MNNDNETLAALWNNNNAALVGIGDGYAETIDRDQAVDEDGKAVFKSYRFEIGDAYSGEVRQWEFTSDEVEDFARTW